MPCIYVLEFDKFICGAFSRTASAKEKKSQRRKKTEVIIEKRTRPKIL